MKKPLLAVIFSIVLIMLTQQVLAYEGWCYQETATTSTGCGGLSTGKYKSTGTYNGIFPATNGYDGDYSTMSIKLTSGSIAFLYINYTIPENANQATSLWQLKTYNGAGDVTTNHSLSDCGWSDTLTLYVQNDANDYVIAKCLKSDNVTYQTLLDSSPGTSLELLHEDGMWWDIANIAPVYSTMSINPATAYTTNDLQCNATVIDDNATVDVEYYWYNSTTLKYFGNTTGVSTSTNSLITTLDSANTTKGETWNCTVRAFDGTNYSTYYSKAITISNSPPTFDEVITTITRYHNQNVSIQFNATDADGDTLTYADNTSLFNINATGYIFDDPSQSEHGNHSIQINVTDDTTSTTWCYQESANVSTACGGLATGEYDWDDDWTSVDWTHDGDWNKYGYDSDTSIDPASLYINYSKHTSASNASLWQVKGETYMLNYSLPNGCWVQEPLQFRFDSQRYSHGAYNDYETVGYCHNSTGWQKLFNYTSEGLPGNETYRYVYEEAMWWHGSYDSFILTYEIINRNPTLTSTNVTPNSPLDADNLTCNPVGGADADDDAITYIYDWLKNDVAQTIDSQVLGAGNTSVGENWKCEVYANDGLHNSSTLTSASVSVGTGFVAPTINYTNATSHSTGLTSDSTNPTNIVDLVNISSTYNDNNTDEVHTLFVCKTDSFIGSNCSSSWGNSAINITLNPLTITLNISSLTSQTYNYYAFVLDNNSQVSASTPGTFAVNHRPATVNLSAPTNNTWAIVNHSNIVFNTSDSDSDSINYTVYGGTTADPSNIIYNGSSTSFNWTGLNSTYYYIKVRARDEHEFESENFSNTILIKIDLDDPGIVNQSLSNSAFETSQTTTFTLDCYDNFSNISTGSVSYDITTPINTTTNEAMALSSGNTYTDTYTPLGTAGTYTILYAYCTDNAGNTLNKSIGLTFVTTAPATAPAGGGGGGGGEVLPPIIVREGNFTITTDVGTGSYELFIAKGGCREKNIFLSNQADIPINLTIKCESAGGWCEYVTISKSSTTLPANINFEEPINVGVCLPSNSTLEFNQSFYFNIVVERTDISPIKRGNLGFEMIVTRWTGLFFDLINKFKEHWTIDLSNIKEDAEPIHINKSFAIFGIPLLYLGIAYLLVKNRTEPLRSTVLVIGTPLMFIMVLLLL